MTAKGVDFTGIAYLAALVVGAVVVYKVVKSGGAVAESIRGTVADVVTAGGQAVGAVVDAVTPTNPNNVFNRAFQPIADLFIGSDPDKKADGSKLLSSFTSFDQEDADQGAAMRLLQRRPDLMPLYPADQDDADLGRAMAEYSGAAFVDYSHLRRGVFH